MGGVPSPGDTAATLDRLAEHGVTMVLPNVGGGIEGLAAFASAAGERSIRVHAWKPIMMNGSQREAHPEWYAVSRSGRSTAASPPYVDYYHFMCPTRAPVRAWLREQVADVAAVPGLASVHLDYIRFPDVILPRALWSTYDLVQDREYPDFDFCYCSVCRTAFQEAGGEDPLSLRDPTVAGAWRRFRWDAISRVVGELAEIARGAGTKVTAAVFPTPAIARRLVRQDWTSWPLDAVMPMLYQGFYEEPVAWIGDGAADGVAALDGRMPLYAGLYIPDLSPAYLADATRLALTAGAAGVVLFDEGAMRAEHWAALAPLLR